MSHVQTTFGSAYHTYHQDEQGSTAYITGQDNAAENCYQYDAFGNLTEKKERIKNRILYTGQQYDQETGQYYLRARYYNPVVGRFLQEDAYRGDGLNLYAYCANNPVMYYDPSGHSQKNCKGQQQDSNKKEHLFGENGTQLDGSKTTGKNGSTERVDVENPAPGSRPGDLHYHEPDNTKLEI